MSIEDLYRNLTCYAIHNHNSLSHILCNPKPERERPVLTLRACFNAQLVGGEIIADVEEEIDFAHKVPEHEAIVIQHFDDRRSLRLGKVQKPIGDVTYFENPAIG